MAAVTSVGILPSQAEGKASKQARSAGFEAQLTQAARERPGSSVAVQRMKTPLSGGQAADALGRAWQSVTGERPSKRAIAVVTAQWAHETGRGRAMHNFNFGGIKGAGPAGLTAQLETREGWGENAQRITASFRAYSTATEGAEDFISLLARRYPKALEAAKAGDANGFVKSLHAGGYFTDNPAAYGRSVSALAEQAMSQGFDAIGGAAGATRAWFAVREQSGVFPDALERMSGQMDQLAFVDGMALAEELGRAAMRVAAEGEGDRERERDDARDDAVRDARRDD